MDADLLVVGEFYAAVPGEALVQLLGQVSHFPVQTCSDALRVTSVEFNEQGVACGALYQGCDLCHASAQQEVTFPVAGSGPVLNFGWSLPYRDGTSNLTELLDFGWAALMLPDGAFGAQVLLEFVFQHVTRLDELGLVNSLVRNPRAGIRRVLLREVARDLLRGLVFSQFVSHERS